MLTIKKAQLFSLDSPRLRELAKHLAVEAGLPTETAVALALRMGQRYKLDDPDDIRQVYALAVLLSDFEFDGRPANAWIDAKLRDSSISSPSRRLALVISEVRGQALIRQYNEDIEALYGLSRPL